MITTLFIHILLIILLTVQICVLIHTFITNHKTYLSNKKFWTQLNEEINETKKHYQLYLEEHPLEDLGDKPKKKEG